MFKGVDNVILLYIILGLIIFILTIVLCCAIIDEIENRSFYDEHQRKIEIGMRVNKKNVLELKGET